MTQNPSNFKPEDLKFNSHDLSSEGIFPLCYNMILRTIILHLDANYKKNPCKDVPLNLTNPAVRDLANDMYSKIISVVIGKDFEKAVEENPSQPIDSMQVFRLTVQACSEVIQNPDDDWFEVVEDSNGQ